MGAGSKNESSKCKRECECVFVCANLFGYARESGANGRAYTEH